jgi:hypothetical protein
MNPIGEGGEVGDYTNSNILAPVYTRLVKLVIVAPPNQQALCAWLE